MPEGARAADWAFEAAGLTKRFGATTAFEDMSVQVPPGSVVGLVGKNGAGRTTLLSTSWGCGCRRRAGV
jgi:ABC-type multidrug transport system ATPase subunit